MRPAPARVAFTQYFTEMWPPERSSHRRAVTNGGGLAGCLTQITSCSLEELPGELYATQSNNFPAFSRSLGEPGWPRPKLLPFRSPPALSCSPGPPGRGTEASAAATRSPVGNRPLGHTGEAAPLRQGTGDALFLLK